MLSEKALLVSLSLGLPPLSKTDKRITAHVRAYEGTDKLRVNKSLLPETAIEPVRAVQQEAYKYHRAHTVAWSDEAGRLLASAHFLEYQDAMRDLSTKHDALADEFTRNWPLYVDEARRTLNGAFCASDYPSQHSIRRRFKLATEFSPVPDAGDFRISIQREEMDALRDSLNARVAHAEQLARADVAARLAGPLAAMAERLRSPDAVFRDTLVSNLREICDLLPALNVTGDAGLEAVRQRIVTELCGADADLLRENRNVRAVTARKAQNILDTMSEYLGDGVELAQAA